MSFGNPITHSRTILGFQRQRPGAERDYTSQPRFTSPTMSPPSKPSTPGYEWCERPSVAPGFIVPLTMPSDGPRRTPLSTPSAKTTPKSQRGAARASASSPYSNPFHENLKGHPAPRTWRLKTNEEAKLWGFLTEEEQAKCEQLRKLWQQHILEERQLRTPRTGSDVPRSQPSAPAPARACSTAPFVDFSRRRIPTFDTTAYSAKRPTRPAAPREPTLAERRAAHTLLSPD